MKEGRSRGGQSSENSSSRGSVCEEIGGPRFAGPEKELQLRVTRFSRVSAVFSSNNARRVPGVKTCCVQEIEAFPGRVL